MAGKPRHSYYEYDRGTSFNCDAPRLVVPDVCDEPGDGFDPVDAYGCVNLDSWRPHVRQALTDFFNRR